MRNSDWSSDVCSSDLAFREYRWPISRDSDWAYRPRGKDERELTLPELWEARSAPPAGIRAAEVNAEYHARIVQILSVLFLPFLAMPLGLGRSEEHTSELQSLMRNSYAVFCLKKTTNTNTTTTQTKQ